MDVGPARRRRANPGPGQRQEGVQRDVESRHVREVGDLERPCHVGHPVARVAAQALDEGVQRDGIGQRELGERLTLGARQQDRGREERVEVVRRDDGHVRAGRRAQLRQNVRQVVADRDQALFRTAVDDAAVAHDAAEHVVAADGDRDEEHAMRVQEVDGLRELVAERIRARSRRRSSSSSIRRSTRAWQPAAADGGAGRTQ